MAELADDLYARITLLTEQGNVLADRGEFDAALGVFREAWDLLPEPREEWTAATWILTAIGDMHFMSGRYAQALDPFQRAILCPDGLGNPFIHMRLGQVQFEVGNIERAKDELARAFMGGGDEIFKDEDPKYWRFIREILLPPVDEMQGPPEEVKPPVKAVKPWWKIG
jgi:tetratricopeptide (TPR) repeat protein